MDLRPYKLSKKQITQAKKFVSQYLLYYQPYIITDTLEVGEGQNLHDGYDRGAIYGRSVYSEEEIDGCNSTTWAKDLPHFRACNADYRKFYESFTDQIAAHFGDEMKHLTFSEMGTNSGLFLFNLARRGAKRCIGYDWNDMAPLFTWMNGILGTKVEFQLSTWDRLYHRLEGVEDAQTDVMISAVVLNHQVDLLAHLAFLCDNARKAVFLWVLTEESTATDAKDAAWEYTSSKQYWVSFTEPNALHQVDGAEWAGNPFPLCFDHGICISEPMLLRSLKILGFGEVKKLDFPEVAPGWQKFCNGFRPYLAIRTNDSKSAYWQNEPASQTST